MPSFSVIIPTYNRAPLLAAALESVVAQRYKNYEVIVVDDGSTDDTQAILGKFDKPVRALRQQNRGPGAARNFGVKHAAGEYVAFLDSDDLWFPWTLSTYARVLDEYERPSLIAVSPRSPDDASVLGHDQANGHSVNLYDDWYACYGRGARDTWFGLPGVVIRTDSLRRVGGFADQNMNAEDIDLLMRLGTEKKFVLIGSPQLVIRRQHESNVTLDLRLTCAGVRHLLDQERAGLYPGGVDRSDDRCQILGRVARYWSHVFLKQRKIVWAAKLYWQSLRMQMRLRRVRYLATFPFKLILALLKFGNRR